MIEDITKQKKQYSVFASNESIYDVDKYMNISHDEYYKKKRHLIVLTDAGKPVYTRYGDESEISPIVATISVIINKLINMKGDGNKLHLKTICTNTTKSMIFYKHNLYIIYITKVLSDHPLLIRHMTDALYNQVRNLLM